MKASKVALYTLQICLNFSKNIELTSERAEGFALEPLDICMFVLQIPHNSDITRIDVTQIGNIKQHSMTG